MAKLQGQSDEFPAQSECIKEHLICHYQMFVSDHVYINWTPHSACPCTFTSPWHDYCPTHTSYFFNRIHATSTTVQPVSDCCLTCISIYSTCLAVQPTSKHCTSCNILQSVCIPHTHVHSDSNHYYITVFKLQHQQHIKCYQLNRPPNSQ